MDRRKSSGVALAQVVMMGGFGGAEPQTPSLTETELGSGPESWLQDSTITSGTGESRSERELQNDAP